jgi:hypothetical protein
MADSPTVSAARGSIRLPRTGGEELLTFVCARLLALKAYLPPAHLGQPAGSTAYTLENRESRFCFANIARIAILSTVVAPARHA